MQTKSFQTKFRLGFVSVIPYLLSYFHCGEKNVTCQNVEVADTYACLVQDPMGTRVGVGQDEHLENII